MKNLTKPTGLKLFALLVIICIALSTAWAAMRIDKLTLTGQGGNPAKLALDVKGLATVKSLDAVTGAGLVIGGTNATALQVGKASQPIYIGGVDTTSPMAIIGNGTMYSNQPHGLKASLTFVNATDTIANTVPGAGKTVICMSADASTFAGNVAVALPAVIATAGTQFWILSGTSGDITMTAAANNTLMCVGDIAAGVIKTTDIGSGIWFISTGTKWLCIPFGISYTVVS